MLIVLTIIAVWILGCFVLQTMAICYNRHAPITKWELVDTVIETLLEPPAVIMWPAVWFFAIPFVLMCSPLIFLAIGIMRVGNHLARKLANRICPTTLLRGGPRE